MHETNELDPSVGQVGHLVDRLRIHNRRLKLATSRGWTAAASIARTTVADTVRELEQAMGYLRSAIQRPGHGTISLGDLYAELQQAESEFGQLDFRPDCSSLVVTTEPIVLNGFPLGPFEIHIHLDRLDHSDCADILRIVALEPNRPFSNDNVTHPHVSDERLCAGEAYASLETTLRCRCFCDVFLLVRSVLQTYNADSAYVTLSNWDGRPCPDCSYVPEDGEGAYCEECDRDFCSECVGCCQLCDRTRCHGCLTECGACRDDMCESCLENQCLQCQRDVCSGCCCEGLCPSCKQKEQTNDNESASCSSERSQGQEVSQVTDAAA